MINNKIVMINMWCSERLFGCPRACGRKWRSYPLTKLNTLCEPLLDKYNSMTRNALAKGERWKRKSFSMAIQPFFVSLSHRRSTTVSLETRNSFTAN